MRLFSLALPAGSLRALTMAATTCLFAVACSESGDFLPADDEAGVRSLDELVLAQCDQRPENTQPVALGDLTFTSQSPENTLPQDSLVTQSCI